MSQAELDIDAPTGGGRGLPVLPLALALVAVSALFLFFPALDLRFSALFYDPAAQAFPAAGNAWLRALRQTGAISIWAVVVPLVAGAVARRLWPGNPRLIPLRSSLFILSSLAVGPGIIANVILKDHWGRPRPVDILAFGGEAPYVPVWRITDYCAQNCSFVSGEASSAIWLTALALVAPPRWRLPVAVATGLYAAALSLNRIAFGGHFLSDVLLAWLLTLLAMALLYRWIRP